MNLTAEVTRRGQREAAPEPVGRSSCQLVLGVVIHAARHGDPGWRHKYRGRQRKSLAREHCAWLLLSQGGTPAAQRGNSGLRHREAWVE